MLDDLQRINANMDNIGKKTKSGLFYSFAERIGAQGVNFLVTIVLARILLPEEFGVISLVAVFIAILDVFVNYGFGNSLIANKNSDDLDFSTCFYFGIVLSIVIYTCVYFAAVPIATFYNNDALVSLIRVMSLRIPFAAINTVQHAFVSKHMMFKKFFYSTSIGTIISGVLSVIMAYSGFGVWALAAQYLGNVVLDTICLSFIVEWHPKLVFSLNRLKTIYSYGWKILVVGLIDTGYNQIRNLVIAKKYTTEDLAFYSRGQQFPSLGMSVIEPSINSVIFPALSNCNDNIDEMRAVTRRITQSSSYVLFPLMVGLIAIAKPLVIVLLTEKWLDCVIYLQLGCLAFMLRPVQVVNVCIIKASGRSGLLLKLDIIKKSIGILLLILSIPFGVVGIAWSLVVTNIISALINVYPNRDLLRYGFKNQFSDLWDSFFISIIMGIIVYMLNYIPCSYIIILFSQIVVGGFIYWFLSVLFKIEAYLYIRNLISGSLSLKKKKSNE